MKRRTLLRTLACCPLLPILARGACADPLPATTSAPHSAGSGILLLAHGSNDRRWNDQVLAVAAQTDASMPTEVAFGMASRATMRDAIARLRARNVERIIAVPLFVSSHSSVIDCTAYLLGLRDDAPPQLPMFAAMTHGGGHAGGQMHDMGQTPPAGTATMQLHIDVPLRISPALDHHPTVAAILGDRAASISREPAHETVLLVAHGPVEDADNQLWLADIRQLASQMRARKGFHAIDCMSLRDDAAPEIRDAASAQLRQRVEQAQAAGDQVLIVPLLLSYGGIERGLRERLQGLAYRMPDHALLPDARIAQWVLASAEDQLQRIAV